jgi:tRNA (adenine57-N1/adenine58-N1)-methyltransferase
MVGHTGFLLTARRIAPGATAPERRRRPAKGAYPAGEDDWSPEDLGERLVSEKRVRRVRRSVAGAPPAAEDTTTTHG